MAIRPKNKYMRHFSVNAVCVLAAALLLSACATTNFFAPKHQISGYYDPHNHLSGVLPWQVYVDLPAYINKLKNQGEGVTRSDKLAFYTWLSQTWYPKHKQDFGTQPYSSTLRYALGARATIEVFPPQPDMLGYALNGSLQRIFTATPFTEFDSAYAFHGPAKNWLANTYYDGNAQALKKAMCTAKVLELARIGITRSEQSISFIGGWGFNANGYSSKLATVLCAAFRPQQMHTKLSQLGLPTPRIRIILMTHTNQLAISPSGEKYKTFEYTGACHWEVMPSALKISPEQIYNALFGIDESGQSIIPAEQRKAFLDTVVGIDTAAPEMTCFTDAGMAYYKQLVDAVYRAAKTRRAHGWNGKLLVHTHVGEGFKVYYGQHQPQKPWTFDSVFSKVPVITGNVVTNAQAPRNNISQLLDAVAAIRATHPDLDQYIIIRFGHVTHATLQQAQRMAELHVEADVNLDSNISTGAWSFVQMPKGGQLAQKVAAAAKQPKSNFKLNDLPEFLIPNPHKEEQVAAVLGTHPLKYLLMADVRVMLGTDGPGVEHSSMPREYALATSLIHYWKANDPMFRQKAANVTKQTFFQNAEWHLINMASNQVMPY